MSVEFEDKSLDADIKVDWASRSVKFQHQVKMNWKKLLVVPSIIVTSMEAVIMPLTYWSSTFPVTSYLNLRTGEVFSSSHVDWIWMSEITAIVAWAFFFGAFFVIYYILPHPKIRDWLIKRRIRLPRETILIPNPSGNINIIFKANTPLIDLEFSESISQHLKTAELVKVKEAKSKRQSLTIQIDGETDGDLIIKRY